MYAVAVTKSLDLTTSHYKFIFSDICPYFPFIFQDTRNLLDKVHAIEAAGVKDAVWSPQWTSPGAKNIHQLAERNKTTLRSDQIAEVESKRLKLQLQSKGFFCLFGFSSDI